jgi:hypothetical protein
VFALLRAASNVPAAPRGLWRFGGGAASVYGDTNGFIGDDFGSSQGYAGRPDRAINQPVIYNVLSHSNAWAMRFNGALFHERRTNTVQFAAAPCLGRGASGFEGDIAEILLFDRVLTDAERDTVGAYLNSLYAVTASPAAPSGLRATGVSASGLQLSWGGAPGANTTLFTVERKTGGAGGYAIVGTARDVNTWLDAAVEPDADYSYRVKAWNYAGESGYSEEIIPPIVRVSQPPAQTPFAVGADATLEALASDTDGSVSRVEFFVNDFSFGAVTQPPYLAAGIVLLEGSCSLHAIATDDQGNSRFSAPVNVVGYVAAGPDDGLNLRVFTPLRNPGN